MINLNKLILFTIILTSTSLTATEFEITPFFGKMYSSDLLQSDEESELSLDGSTNFGIAIAWQDSSNGKGQILINSISHDFESDIDSYKHSLDIIYTHFSGIAQFRQQSYVTTVSLGLGGAYFDAEGGEELYPSATIAFGTRYEFSDRLSFVTELRGYASLVDAEDAMFCYDDVCSAEFDGSLWIDSSISLGIAVKF